jgi:hypothetical protein
MAQYVRYGDYLMVVGMNTCNNLSNKTLVRGYLQAFGGVDDNLYFKELNTKTVSDEQNDWEELFDSENESLFRIIPRLGSKHHSKLAKMEMVKRSNKKWKNLEDLDEAIKITRELVEKKKCQTSL